MLTFVEVIKVYVEAALSDSYPRIEDIRSRANFIQNIVSEYLADLMQCGVAMLSDALSWCTKVTLEAGYVVVLETAGRSGHWTPHLHILMTSGGMTPQQQWREVDSFPFTVLHKKWQYHLCTMLKQRVGTRAIKDTIDALWRKYPRGLVAYLEEGKVPAGGEGLAYSLAQYVVSPPISLRRILRYDGQRVRYWYNDHKTKRRQEEEVSALTFIGRMVQHMLPKGFHRIRYYGLHAPCKVKKVKGLLTVLMVALGRLIKGTYRITARPSYRERVLASTGRDPLHGFVSNVAGRKCLPHPKHWCCAHV